MRRERTVPENAKTFIISEVIRNAEMIERRIADNGITKDSYARSTEYQGLLTMPMLRICELVSEYTNVISLARRRKDAQQNRPSLWRF